MKQVIIDIETSRMDLKDLSESQQEYILREAEKETDIDIKQKKMEDAEKNLSLFPFTARIIVIGYFDVQKEKTYVMYEGNADEEKWESESGVVYKGLPEKEMLQQFWHYIEKFDQVITFNGRSFDIPFLMLRSAMLGIRPTRNLLGNRYSTDNHLDLLEVLSFFGVSKKFNLDFYCHSFGIESPKSKGITGMEVHELYNAGKIKEVAGYCAGDVNATYKLYKVWDSYLNI
jgi:3'-5' exonuclease